MSFIKKIAASVGLGAAQVDTILEKSTYVPGEMIRGTVHIRGGQAEQEIDDIDLIIMARYIIEQNDTKSHKESKIAVHRVTSRFLIQPGETKEIPVQLQLPLDTPVSLGSCAVWLRTNLEINNGIDATDNDKLQIRPHPWVQNILNAMQTLGFRLYEADCEYAPVFQRRLPFVQEFEFRPQKGTKNRRRLDEVEIVCHIDSQGVEVIIEVDRKARGVIGWLEEQYNLDESLVRTRISKTDIEQQSQVTKQLKTIINKHTY